MHGKNYIDDNGSILSSGNILSTGKITAVHGDYNYLYGNSMQCTSSSFYNVGSKNNGLVFVSHIIYHFEVDHLQH